jgi:hypothetical protein
MNNNFIILIYCIAASFITTPVVCMTAEDRDSFSILSQDVQVKVLDNLYDTKDIISMKHVSTYFNKTITQYPRTKIKVRMGYSNTHPTYQIDSFAFFFGDEETRFFFGELNLINNNEKLFNLSLPHFKEDFTGSELNFYLRTKQLQDNVFINNNFMKNRQSPNQLYIKFDYVLGANNPKRILRKSDIPDGGEVKLSITVHASDTRESYTMIKYNMF